MPAEFDDCVTSLKKQGKKDDSAYAICVASYKKKHGKSPFHKKEEIDALPISEQQKRLFKAAFEAEQSGRTVKVLNERTGSIIATSKNDTTKD